MPNYSLPRGLWILFLGALFVQLIGSLLYFVVFTGSDWVQSVYLGTKLLLVFIPLFFLALKFPLPPLTLRPNLGISLKLGIRTGVLLSLMVIAIYAFSSPFLQPAAILIQHKVTEFGFASYYLLVAIVFSVLHSLFEEYYWRWFIVGGLSIQLTPLTALVIGNAGFALHHYILLAQFLPLSATLVLGTCVGIAGMIWSFVYQKTGSLLGSWISHALVDGILFYLGYQLLLQ